MVLETERREGVIYIWMFYIPLLCKSLYIYMCIYIEALFQMCVCVSHSVVSDSFVTPRTVAHQASLSIGFSRQEYWSGLPFPSPGDLSGPGIKNGSAALQADSLPSGPPGKPIPLQAKVKQLPLSLPDTFRIWKLLNTLFMAT